MAAAEPGPKLSQMSRREWRDLALMALLGLVGFTVLMLEGLKRTAAADAGIITATLPAVVAALGVLFVGDRLSRLQIVAVGLSVAGLLLVQATSARVGGATLVGNLLVAGAVLCEASFVILGKRLAPPYRPLRLALGANLAGLVLAIPLALLDAPAFDPRSVTLDMWVLGTWYALSASVLLPVAVVRRVAARGDLARRPGDGGHAGRRARHLRALPGRDHRPGAPGRRRPGHRRHRAGGAVAEGPKVS